MADHRGARARQRLEEMLSSLAHLTNAAGTPPHMGLGVDEDRWACRIAIGNSICREAVDVVLGSWKAVHLALPEGKDRAGAREPDHPAAGQCVSLKPVETAFGHESPSQLCRC